MHLSITDLALGGDGVGRLADGRTAFVPFTIPGEEVEVELVSEHKRFVRARLVKVVKPSPDRVAPRCPLFGRCGGCQYQHMTYAAQLAAKTRQLGETLVRLGGFRDGLPEIAAVRSPQEFGYRNKIRLEPLAPAEAQRHGIKYGFHATDNETILPVESCPLAVDSLNRLLAEENSGVRSPESGVKNPSVAGHRTPDAGRRIQPATGHGPQACSLTLRQPAVGDAVAFAGGRSNTALQPAFLGEAPNDAKERGLKHRATLVERVLGRDVRVAPDGFWQVNPGVAAELVRLVAEWAAENPAEQLVDAYGGVGVFGLAAGNSCKRLTVIEVNAEAVRLARANFAAWGLGNAEFIAQPTERALPRLLSERSGGSPDVILDPPRGGCDAAVLGALAKHPPRRLLYISCNPATLARDLRALTQPECRPPEGGTTNGAPFRLERLALLDMFPQTAHFETMAVLSGR